MTDPLDAARIDVGQVDAPVPEDSVLDNPVWASLTGAHGYLAEVLGGAGRYPDEVSQFAALADPADPSGWHDLGQLLGPGQPFALATVDKVTGIPDSWQISHLIEGRQYVDTALRAEPDPQALLLGPADVPEMLDLVRRTEPGPFRPRTIELGTYLGIRREGVLVAMAGERMHPPGWTEISAVCTDPSARGQGLATRLVRAVAAVIRDRGETPFLHTAADNPAIRLYESIGFTLRRPGIFTVGCTPTASGNTTPSEQFPPR